jgi:signal transduction histidine kinase
MQSLSRVLTVRFSLTMLLGLLLVGLWAFLGTRFVLNRQIDRGLRSTYELESAVLGAGLPIPFQAPWVDEADFIARVNNFVIIRDRSGHIVTGNVPASATLPLDSMAFAGALKGKLGWSRRQWRGHTLRSVFGPAPLGSRHDWAVIQVATSLEDLEHSQTWVFWLMVGTVLATTAAAGLGAGWLAQSSTAPVGEIIEQAEHITGGTSDGRITAHADVLEYRDLVRVLNGMLSRLNGALSAQRRIIADTGHDIRTPITAMQGHLEVTLRSDRSPEQYREVLRTCLEEVEHLGTISNSLLLLARLEAGEVVPERRSTDVTRLLTDAVQRAHSGSLDRTVELDVQEGLVASIDGQMMHVALDHLIGNALQHTPPDTRVTVRGSADDSSLAITVEDGGPGIADELLPRLFERMFRGDEARSRTGGTGLGLAITEEIIKVHGGTATADRSPMGGLRITIRLPADSRVRTGEHVAAGVASR